jgi:hypothetical protein
MSRKDSNAAAFRQNRANHYRQLAERQTDENLAKHYRHLADVFERDADAEDEQLQKGPLERTRLRSHP